MEAEEEEDIYDFSGLSLSDLCAIGGAGERRTTLGDDDDNINNVMMMLRPRPPSSSSSALFEGVYDDEEWYPPTPPPYEVAEKLAEANRRLVEDPTSDVHVADRLRWRRSSSLVEIR